MVLIVFLQQEVDVFVNQPFHSFTACAGKTIDVPSWELQDTGV